jgi:hypothetical protein
MARIVYLCNDNPKQLMELHASPHSVVRRFRRSSRYTFDMFAVSSVMKRAWVDRGKAPGIRTLTNDAQHIIHDIRLQHWGVSRLAIARRISAARDAQLHFAPWNSQQLKP